MSFRTSTVSDRCWSILGIILGVNLYVTLYNKGFPKSWVCFLSLVDLPGTVNSTSMVGSEILDGSLGTNTESSEEEI